MKQEKNLSVSEYAKREKISKMQVIRRIREGKVVASRVGKAWSIPENQTTPAVGYEKTSSIQKWDKIIQENLHKKLGIEKSKDRESIYSKLFGLGLPHERCIAFGFRKNPTFNEFSTAANRLDLPYWISAVPDPSITYLNRLTKLNLQDVESGWAFIQEIKEKENYKIIVSQYPTEVPFKGTVMISKNGKGMAEFITGDRHYIMTRGFTLTDPMLFDQKSVVRFSKTISKAKQRRLHSLVKGVFGHLELQFGKIEGKKHFTFFDYNEEEAYTEIDEIWGDLVEFFKRGKKSTKRCLYGLPASPGKVEGRCVVVHHESIGLFNAVEKGDIVVSDTTTPEMTLVMGKASAIVTDLGGVTSHAAIVCRELRIPAIVGVGDATDRLRTGDVIRVDATKGEVTILARV